MKKVFSLIIAIVMFATIVYVPTSATVYGAENGGSSNVTVSLSTRDYKYTGQARKPIVTVKSNGETLDYGSDYTVRYYNNIYPGKATAKVHLKNSGKTISKSYYISRVEDIRVKEYGTTTLRLGWSKEANVTGYKLYRYSVSSKSWKLVKTIKGNDNNAYTVKYLAPGYGYQFRVKSYVTKNGKTYYSYRSETFSAPTIPRGVTLKSFTTSKDLSVRATWKKTQGSGYQVLIARNKDFSYGTKFNVKSKSTLTKKITGLKDGKTYRVKVRAYTKFGGKTVYGKWSKVKTVTTDGNGWATINGKRYYFRDGNRVRSSWTLGGNKYYFSTKTGELLGASDVMWNKVKNQTSKTPWLIAVSRDLNRTCVYKRVNGQWVLKEYWKCTTGAKGTRTPGGAYTVPSTKTHLRYFGEGLGYTCWYATRIVKSIYFHSVLYNTDSMTSIQDGRLGYNLSHGCIRLAKDNAHWIYKNIDAGTKVVIY